MKYDGKIAELMSLIHSLTSMFLAHPNPCAYTDRIVEDVINQTQTLKEIKEKQDNL